VEVIARVTALGIVLSTACLTVEGFPTGDPGSRRYSSAPRTAAGDFRLPWPSLP
jgi:hypothetical protein